MERSELFQIGEVSRLFHISISTLRYYDKIGIVRPEYTDRDTGYRYYSTTQFERLNTIRYLRALDMPLEEIAAFLQNRNIPKIQELLQRQQEDVKRRQKQLQAIERKIQNRLLQIQDALASQLEAIRVIRSPSRRITAIKKNLLPQDYQGLEYSIRQLEEEEDSTVTFLGKVGVGISEGRLLRREIQSYDMVFIILDEEDDFKGSTRLLPEETCVSIRFQGRHEDAPGYYGKLLQFIEEKGYSISGFSKEITMIDYGLTNDTSKFVTEIQIPVTHCL